MKNYQEREFSRALVHPEGGVHDCMDRYFAPGKICIPHIPVGYAGDRAPKVGALGDTGAVAEGCTS